ncbi:hypothetical protein P171DRAFT_426100 [Karstenula rhodostoma CBS 690.94]|uniref:RNA polymerase I-specific transcription initiation factor RRN6-like protein n=1 Tax=Karstenula rhodostoma CBS 690.94 TaxID=1392251 RepID=A0A9P4PUH4_9PLEO|nr:hypothetical protein P171DRAFT_426100 [Karstenula rhodostoma CBS 690.94]
MTDDSPNDLNTGHFGVPAYDLENSRWAFVRSSTGASFRQLDPWKTVVPPAIRFPPPRDPRTLRAARHATKSLARELPELVPASEHVSELEAVSAATTVALSAHNATVGQLMSFGTITPLGNRAHLAKGVVALPAGEGGNILRLQLLSKEKRGWGSGAISDSLCYLDCLSWKGELGFWNQDATAVQQICFAHSEKPGSFLAVRLPRRVALFRPAYRHRPAAAAKSRLYDLPPSVIDIHPFHSVWSEDTGKTPYADVAFNPHYQRQFAIVDQKSSWSVWDIDGTRRSYVVKRATSGNMSAKEDDNEEQAENLEPRKEDGWARVMWVGDANTLLVCNRKRIELIDLKQPPRSLIIPQVIEWRSTTKLPGSWILDVKRHPSLDEKQFFVLTSTRLYLFAMTSDEPRGNLGEPDASIVLSWTHFRGTEDVTLQLYTQSISNEETVVFIHSRVNMLVTIYRFVDQTSTGAPYRTFGPTMLRLDNFDNAQSSKRFLDLNIAHVDFKETPGGSRGAGDDYMDRGIHFYQLSAVFDDFSVAQTMLCTLGHDSSDDTLKDVNPTSWVTAVKPVVFRSKNVVDSDEDDFIEPDGPTRSKEPCIKSEFQQLKRYQMENAHSSRDIFNFTDLYEAIGSINPFPLHHAGTLSESIDSVALVEEIKWRLEREENVEPFTLGTLQEYAEAIVTVEDIEDASTKLQELFSINEYASSLEPQKIASDLVLGFGGQGTQASSLSTVYDLVLQSWLASLPGTIPARIRQSKERSARRLAAGLLLASTRIRHSNDQGNPPVTNSDSNQNVALDHSSPPQSSSQADWRLHSSQPSDPIGHNTPRTSNAALSNPLARLSKHLHMTNVTLPEVPPSINQVLSHWRLQADPFTYDWEATERAFAEDLELEQEGMPKKRERARRKKERQAKRQRRENELYTGRIETGKVESQPQLLRSSPGPAAPAISSQPAPSQNQTSIVQSQVEPGKHGGRPMKKKKVKSRMSGF